MLFGLSVLLALRAPAMLGADTGLYAPPPPPGSAFVRLVVARSGAAAVRVGSRVMGDRKYGDVSDYYVVAAGDCDIGVGEEVAFRTSFESGRYYSVVLAEEPRVIRFEDTMSPSRTRAMLAVYNLSDLPAVELRAADGTLAVVDDVGAGGMGSRLVNPIRIDFSIHRDGRIVWQTDQVALGQGGTYSVFLFGSAGSPIVRWVVAKTVEEE